MNRLIESLQTQSFPCDTYHSCPSIHEAVRPEITRPRPMKNKGGAAPPPRGDAALRIIMAIV